MISATDDYFVCPHCDARVSINALSCPECGSDDETGWSNETIGDDSQADLIYTDAAASKPRVFMLWPLFLLIPIRAAYLGNLLWGLVLLLVFLAVGGLFVARDRWNLRPRKIEHELHLNLLRKAGGDEKLVASIIANEQRRNPQSNRAKAMESAIEKWERDNK